MFRQLHTRDISVAEGLRMPHRAEEQKRISGDVITCIQFEKIGGINDRSYYNIKQESKKTECQSTT